jgi:glycosyltransferase involved in cell wall biosynthesis
MDRQPLVSIIVRTKDRPGLLKRALQSIAAQTYRPIEVVLVNDGGCDLDVEELKTILGDVSLNYIRLEKNTGRAHAGNVGIENAKGEYIGFLDDDDEFYQEHVETLVTFLRNSNYRVAYTSTEMIFSGQLRASCNEPKVFSKDFSYPEMLIVNYIPFNSLMFHKQIMGNGVKFDESLEFYEDWDFLINVAQEYPFWHIDRVTARYNQWDREIQINNRDEEQIRSMHLRIMDKHRGKIRNEFILQIYNERSRLMLENNDLQRKISKLEESIREKDASIREKDASIREKDASIREKDARISIMQNNIILMQDTLGWKVLDKIRLFREKILPIGTFRRKVYNILAKSMKIIIREGFRGFYSRVRFRLESSVGFYKYLLKKALLILRRNGFRAFIGYGSQYLINGKDLQKRIGMYDYGAYEEWIEKNEKYDELRIRKEIEELRYKPKISIITPVFNPQKKVFVEMLESIVKQTYYNWELCLADASSVSYVREIVESYVSNYKTKIKVKYLKTNQGISGNSNEALSMADGEYVALLDHDDTLAPFALFEVVKCINKNPEVDFIYSDRDIITTEGKRMYPFFKPDWSPDFLLSQNYICHFNVIRKSLLDSLGGFREGYDGSQDYDLILRVAEATDKICHIPKILYHWRTVKGSCAVDPEAKPYAYDAALKALNDAFVRRGWKGRVIRGMSPGYYNPVFYIDRHERVSIIIASESKENGKALKRCMNSIQNTKSYDNCEIIIVKSVSSDIDVSTVFQDKSNIKVLSYNGCFNLYEMYNFAVLNSEGEHVFFLSEDAEIINNGWLEFMLGLSQRGGIGVVGAKLLYPNGYIQAAGFIVNTEGNIKLSHHKHPPGSSGYNGRLAYICNVSAVSDVCMLVKRKIFEAVSGFEPSLSVLAPIDLCFKIRQRGLLVVYEPRAEIVYHSDLSLRYEHVHKEALEAFIQKWNSVIAEGDPYYNPNLEPKRCDFSIKL